MQIQMKTMLFHIPKQSIITLKVAAPKIRSSNHAIEIHFFAIKLNSLLSLSFLSFLRSKKTPNVILSYHVFRISKQEINRVRKWTYLNQSQTFFILPSLRSFRQSGKLHFQCPFKWQQTQLTSFALAHETIQEPTFSL